MPGMSSSLEVNFENMRKSLFMLHFPSELVVADIIICLRFSELLVSQFIQFSSYHNWPSHWIVKLLFV